MATYSFDEQSVKRIGDAVRKVERMGGDRNEPPIEYPAATESFRTVIRGRFSGEWAKGTAKDVDFIADNGDSKTKTATNYFVDVGTAANTTDCIIMLVGSEWVLVSADPAGSTECAELSKVEPAGNLTLLSAINPTGSFVQSISGSVVTAATISPVTVVTGVACVNGNISVTTATLNLSVNTNDASTFATTASLADAIGYTERTVRLTDLANVTTQNVTLPPQTGCS